ncbi:hypothetical protein ECZU43_53730 [Escherichia coli]|nr:hypothetical protein ECZU43_53730 [Escherichia coli]
MVIDKIQLLMAVVTVAALVASAMGIASLMTSTIMERAKEIGLMKALGARQWQIMLLFYLEAASSGLAGGALGCIAGWGLAKAIGVMLFDAPLNFARIVVPCVLVIAVLIALIGTVPGPADCPAVSCGGAVWPLNVPCSGCWCGGRCVCVFSGSAWCLPR